MDRSHERGSYRRESGMFPSQPRSETTILACTWLVSPLNIRYRVGQGPYLEKLYTQSLIKRDPNFPQLLHCYLLFLNLTSHLNDFGVCLQLFECFCFIVFIEEIA